RALDHSTAVERLRDQGVPIGLVQTPREALNSEQARHRNTVQTFQHSTVGTFQGITTPLRRTGETAPAMSAPPELGADTLEILRDVLQLDDTTIDRLHHEEAVLSRRSGKVTKS